ncbi:hypothetical protein, partial [Methylobacterium sp. C25]|uniref:hypothetical protein n=1 Tax=Methylobacterium sp. C25 TaxID=2721622 RepID=UPI001F3F8712
QRRAEIGPALRQDHAGRHDLVDRRIRAVATARERIETNITLKSRRKAIFQITIHEASPNACDIRFDSVDLRRCAGIG